MKYDILTEELNIKSGENKLDKNFRKYIEQVFSKQYLKKIDRVFKDPLVIEDFKEKSNVMALTVGSNISVNIKMFQSLPVDRAMVYIVHELFHVLQNKTQFPEIKRLNNELKNITLRYVKEEDINKFLTGKEQDIHSDYNQEFISYCSNFAFDWKLAPQLKKEYYNILSNSGIFDMESKWWKKRFKD